MALTFFTPWSARSPKKNGRKGTTECQAPSISLLTDSEIGKHVLVPFFLLVLQSLAKTIPVSQLWLWPSVYGLASCYSSRSLPPSGFIAACPPKSSKEDHTHFPINQRLFLGERESLYIIIFFPWFKAEAAMAVGRGWATKSTYTPGFCLFPYGRNKI